MPINQNHLFEELDGVKCSVVEKNVSKERVEFLKNLLEYNNYTVIVAATPAAKPVPSKPVAKPVPKVDTAAVPPAEVPATPVVETAAAPAAPETFTVGVTNLMFNPTNAVFGRLLLTPGGHMVTLAYWQQKEEVPHDEVPYYERSL